MNEYFCRGCGLPVWRKEAHHDDVHQEKSPGPDYHRVQSAMAHSAGVAARLKAAYDYNLKNPPTIAEVITQMTASAKARKEQDAGTGRSQE
jgi:hypothetical protein